MHNLTVSKHSPTGRIFLILLFLAVETVLYLIFVTLDFTSRLVHFSTILKYASIAICMVTAWLLLLPQKSGGDKVNKRDKASFFPGRLLIPVAMLLTLFADTFLLLLDRYYLVGVLAFCLVQTLYAVRLLFSSAKPPRPADAWIFSPVVRNAVLLRLGLFLAVILGLGLSGLLDALTAASAYSFVQLTLNAIFSWILLFRRQTSQHSSITQCSSHTTQYNQPAQQNQTTQYNSYTTQYNQLTRQNQTTQYNSHTMQHNPSAQQNQTTQYNSHTMQHNPPTQHNIYTAQHKKTAVPELTPLLLSAIGLTLFWGCDACVGLYNITAYLPDFPFAGLIAAASMLMWVFYLPAQVLIVLSNITANTLLPLPRSDNTSISRHS